MASPTKPPLVAKIKKLDKRERERRLEKILELAHNSYVTAGILEPDTPYPPDTTKSGKPKPTVTLGQVAAWQEFGTHTAAGIGVVPARSFFRTPIDEGMDAINKTRERVLNALIYEKISIADALGALGATVQRLSQNAITRGIAPPLAISTIRRKRAEGSPDTPLLTVRRFLFGHITYEVTLEH